MLTFSGPELVPPGGVLAPTERRLPFRPALQVAAHPILGSRLIISAALHVAAVLIALVFYQAQPPREPRSVVRPPAKLVAVIYLPPTLPEILPPAPPPPSPVAKVEPLVVEPPAPLPEPAPPKPIERRIAEVTPVRQPPPAAEAPAVPLPKPAPAVVVGAFSNNAASVRAPEVSRPVETVAFDAPVARGAEPKPSTVATAGFDRAPTEPRATPAGSVAATNGFDRAAPAQAARPTGAVRETGFGNSEARARPTEPARSITPTGFDDAPKAQAAAKPAPVAPPSITPVEVVSKPSPAYTEEARKLRIEGEVVLDVEFGANGSVRVLGVVRGLGHGLDESAVRAAQQIQFKPARDGSRAVDFRTTVHIVFRLA